MHDHRFLSRLSRLLTAALCACMLLTGAPASAIAELADPEETAVLEEATEPSELVPEDLATDLPVDVTLDLTIDVTTNEPLDNDALFDTYVQQLLDAPLQGESGSEDIPLTAQTVPLEGIDGTLYAELRTLVNQVASGTLTSTDFNILATDLLETTQWNADDLGFSTLVYQGDDGKLHFIQDAVDEVRAMVTPHLDLVLSALIADCPYDLYWLDNTNAISMKQLTISGIYVGDELYMTVAKVKDSSTGEMVDQYLNLSMRVADDYATSELEVDSTKVQRAKNAVLGAQAIVDETSDLAPYERLYAFMQRICLLVTYDQDAIDDDRPYGDPWQLISVFDGDESTNVVCEGYSKAFKYLCDLANIRNVSCRLVSGPMGGGTGAGAHMWNIVNMPDRLNYLVDVTNCDEDSVGTPDLLFIAIPESGSYVSQYVFNPNGCELTYSYDEETLGHYEPSELTLSSTPYDPSAAASDPIDLSGAVVYIGDAGLVYSGEVLTPSVSVELDGVALSEGVDYTLAYSDNVDAGTAHVTVSGIGDYTGSIENVSFEIQRRPVTVFGGALTKTYGGADPSLQQGAYSEGTIGDDTVNCTFSRKAGENVGTYQLLVTGEEQQGNYQVSYQNGTLTIKPRKLVKNNVGSIANQAYTGSKITPVPKVAVNGKTLKKGTDYTLSWTNNVKLGTATVTVTGKGNYTGSASVTFKIVKSSVAKATVSSIATQKYDGTAKKPTPTVKLGGRTLKRGTDYTLSWKNNVKAGTATLTITGKGNYAGGKSVTFKIAAVSGTWKKSGSRWWYQWKDGTYPKSVFLDISGKTYRFDGSGWMLTGWQKVSNKWYYFGSDGVMVKSKWVGNYYLQADGTLATNKWIGNYHVDANGKWDRSK